MAIKIADPIVRAAYIHFTISYEDALMLKRIRDKIGLIDAIRCLRWYNKDCGLKQAKEFIEGLDV